MTVAAVSQCSTVIPDQWPWPMTLTFNRRRARVMTHTHTRTLKFTGQSVQKTEWKQTDRQTDRRTLTGGTWLSTIALVRLVQQQPRRFRCTKCNSSLISRDLLPSELSPSLWLVTWYSLTRWLVRTLAAIVAFRTPADGHSSLNQSNHW